MAWTDPNIAKITVKDAVSPGDTFNFDGMAARNSSQQSSYIQPYGVYPAIQAILDIGGLSAVQSGITRTIKQTDGE